MSKIGGSKTNDKEEKLQDNTSAIPIGVAAYSKWSGRFTWAAIIQGGIVAVLTAMLAIISASTPLPQRLVEMILSRPAIGFSEVAALVGLGLYLIVGVIGTGLTAQFYHHFEVRLGRAYRGLITSGLAWIHLILLNVGIAAASILMIYAGYMGDLAVSPIEIGGLGLTTEQAAQQFLNPFIVPVAIMLLVIVVGALAGGFGFVINYLKKDNRR